MVRVLPPLLFSLCAGSILVVPGVAAPQRLEGTLSLAQNGNTQQATLKWEAPDHLKIEIPRDEVTGAPAQIIVASGNDTQVYDPNTRRLRHLGFNIAQKWWRGWSLSAGGPANFLLVGATPGMVTEEEGAFSRRDKVLFGGEGKGGYYAAWKLKDRRWAREITTTATSRIEKNDAGRETLRATLEVEGELPKSATVTALGATATYTYDLKAREAAFDAATWAIPDAGKAVLEEDDLKAASAYRGTDGASLYNRAMAFLRGSEDVPAAIATLEQAKTASPDASAPALALFELGLAGRDWARAERALTELSSKGVTPEEVETRRARLLLARRDYKGALKAFDTALVTAPTSADLKLRRSQVLRVQGQLDDARAIWLGLLSDESAPMLFRVAAVDALVQFNAPDEWGTLRERIKGDSEPEQLAKSLFALRLGDVPATTRWKSNDALLLWALGTERAGQDEAALAAWNELEKSGDGRMLNRARAHKVALAAQRGDATASIEGLRAWSATLNSEQERDAAKLALFDAWQKVFKQASLESALDNRANATAANNDDLQLSLAFQNVYGDVESNTRIIETALVRFSNDPFWKSKQADQLSARAIGLTTTSEASRAARSNLFRQVFEAIDSAVKAVPDQPFYAMQRALVAAQRSARQGFADAGIATSERKVAYESIERLLTAFPDDPDAQLSAAMGLFALGGENDLPRVVQLATAAINSPSGDGDRHVLVSAARQTLAIAYEKLNRPQEAAATWLVLLAAAQNVREQAQFASLYLGLLERTNSVPLAAQLVAQIAGDGWASEDAREAVDAVARRVLNSPLLAPIAEALHEAGSPQALLAWATINQIRLVRARGALTVPGAPASADAELERATRDLNVSVGLLRPVAEGNDPVMAARVGAFLAQRAGISPEEGLPYLRRAIDIEPTDAALRLALADALVNADPSSEEAKTQRRIAAQTLNFNPETQRILSLLYWVANDDNSARALSKESLNITARSPEFSANDFQRQAFSRAHILWTAGGQAEATELYKGLASEQWLDLDRAAAFLGWRARFVEANQTADAARISTQLQALGLSPQELERAAVFLDSVEN